MKGPLPPTRRDILIPLSVVSTSKGLLTSSAYQKLMIWGSESPKASGTNNTLSTPRTGRFNSIRMKWVYHALKPKKKYMEFVQTFQETLKISPRKKSLHKKSLMKPRELLDIHLRETLNPWRATT